MNTTHGVSALVRFYDRPHSVATGYENCGHSSMNFNPASYHHNYAASDCGYDRRGTQL